ncbi:MAG: hypothetical protein L6R42_010418, partial [Xanthoria sp. 1 TBL-2021]
VAGMPYESLGFREIVQNCTSWPEWTYFSTIVQHQNLAQDFELALDRISYKVGAQGAQDTLADLTLVSTPKGGDKLEVTLSFIDDGSISKEFVQNALDSMCSLAQNLVRSPTSSILDVVSKSAISVSLTQHQRNPQPMISSPSSRPALDSLLRGASKKEVTDLADTLARGWRLVLPTAKNRQFILNLDSSFYESGGDLISLASLTAILEEQGWDLKLEDLISRPTMGEQVSMLWKLKTKKGAGSGASSSDTLNNSTHSAGSAAAERDGNDAVVGEGEKKKGVWWKKGLGVLKGKGRRKGKKDVGRVVAMTTASVAA